VAVAETIVLPPDSHCWVPTGLSFTFPVGTYGRFVSLPDNQNPRNLAIAERNEHGNNSEAISLLVSNRNGTAIAIPAGTPIAQVLVTKVQRSALKDASRAEESQSSVSLQGGADKGKIRCEGFSPANY
jgi:dUTPase